MDKHDLVSALMMTRHERKFFYFSPIILLAVVVCLLVACFPIPGNSAQKQISREWVTPAVNFPGLSQHFFRSAAAGTDVSFHVYAPDVYMADKERRFPVIYWLHGHGGGATGMPQVVAYFDRAMRDGKIPPALVVFPNGMAESMWSNSKDGKVPMEKVVIDELIPQIDASWRTIPSRVGRLIEGFSMGGYGAARLGIKYPEIFGALSMLGAGPMQLDFDASIGPINLSDDRTRIMHDVYGDDQAYFKTQSPWALAEQHADAMRGRTRVRIAVGGSDVMQGPNEKFAAHLSSLKIPHEYHLVPNVVHNPVSLFQALGDTNWDFYRAALGGQVVSNQSMQPPDVAPQPIRFAQNREQRQKVAIRLRQFDRGDGLIRLIDLPAPVRGRFRYLDTNHDDQIDATELSQFLL